MDVAGDIVPSGRRHRCEIGARRHAFGELIAARDELAGLVVDQNRRMCEIGRAEGIVIRIHRADAGHRLRGLDVAIGTRPDNEPILLGRGAHAARECGIVAVVGTRGLHHRENAINAASAARRAAGARTAASLEPHRASMARV